MYQIFYEMKSKLCLKIGGVKVFSFVLIGILLCVAIFGFIIFQKSFVVEEGLPNVPNESSFVKEIVGDNIFNENFSVEEVVDNNISKKIKSDYPWHRDITVTYFWIGEGADEENAFISNLPSAWDEEWVEHYGGVDDPEERDGYYPVRFVPKENPFYFALPYNDFNDEGGIKDEALSKIYWANKGVLEGESLLKNRWIEVVKNEVICYAQWEDVGPMIETDIDYVFGSDEPGQKNFNDNAGLDVSPAMRDCLGIEGIDKISWRFINFAEVPEGDWKNIITVSGVNWK